MSQIRINNVEPKSSVEKNLLAQLDMTMRHIRERAYELFLKRGSQHGTDLDDWLHAEQEVLFPVQFTTTQSPGSYLLQLSVPGFNAKDLEIYRIENRLIVAGGATANTHDSNGLSAEERAFFYQWPLPEGARTDEIKAEFASHKLSISIPVGTNHEAAPASADATPRDPKNQPEETIPSHREFEYVNSASPLGGAGGLGYPTHPQGENAFDALEETLSIGTQGVDVSGVQTGAGNTRITITPSLSMPKRKRNK